VWIITHSPCRGEALSLPDAAAASGGSAVDPWAADNDSDVAAWPAWASLAGIIFVVVQLTAASEISTSWYTDSNRIVILTVLRSCRRGPREARGKEFSNPVLCIIKRAPGPSASYKSGVTSFLNELQMKGRLQPDGNTNGFEPGRAETMVPSLPGTVSIQR
jgi:hypothetical protein